MGNNEKNPIESGLDELKEIIAKLEEKGEAGLEGVKKSLEGVKEKLEAGIEKAKEEVPEPPKGIKEFVNTGIEGTKELYAAGMMPATPGEAPAVGIPSEDDSVPKIVEDIAAVPEKIGEAEKKIKETIDEAAKTSIETMNEAYAAGMTPTAPGEAPAVGIPSEDDSVPKIVEDIASIPEKIGEGEEKIREAVEEAVKTSLETMDEAYAAGMTPTAPGEAPAVGIPESEISEDDKIDIPTPKELFETSVETMAQTGEVGMNPLDADPGIVLPREE